MPELDLSSAEAGALQYLQGIPADGSGSTPEESGKAQSGQGEVTPEIAQGPKVAQLGDDDLVELEVGGQKVQKPWKQARQEMMLHADYTRKRQEEARIVKEAEQLVEKIRKRDAAYNALISDPRNIVALYEAVTGQRLSVPEQAAVREAAANDEIATMQDVARVIEEQKKEAEVLVESKIQELQDAMFLGEVERTTTTTINALLEENKQISAFYTPEEASLLLKRMAREKQPSSVEELRDALVEAGKALAQRVDARMKEMQKQSAVQQTKLTKQGIEPSGGTGLPAQPKAYGDGKSIAWGDIDKDAQAFVEARISR